MAKNNGKGGFWDDFFNNPFGGIFDFDGDGKEDLGEQWIGYKIFEETTKESFEDDSEDDFACDIPLFHNDSTTVLDDWRDDCTEGILYDVYADDYDTREEYEEALEEAKAHEWRKTADVDTGVDVDPDDFETEEEYLDAVTEAQNEWKSFAEDGSEYGLNPNDFESEDDYNEALLDAQTVCAPSDSSIRIPIKISLEAPALDKLDSIKESDYPNKRRYDAAYTLANEFLVYSSEELKQKEQGRCRFILENADKLVAANYLTASGSFLYAQAIKDHFDLPIHLPDEDDRREYSLCDALVKIAKRNISSALDIWRWCVEQFMPYAEYDQFSRDAMAYDVLNDLCDFPKTFPAQLVAYMSEHKEFRNDLIYKTENVSRGIGDLIYHAIQAKQYETADELLKGSIQTAGEDWRSIIGLVNCAILACKTYDELETMEYFDQHLFDHVRNCHVGMVQDEIDEWQADIKAYIAQVEKDCDKYAYVRCNAWRKTVPDGEEYDIDPRDYCSEQEYLEAYQREKYRWRNRYSCRGVLGVNPNDYDSEDEFLQVLTVNRNEKRECELAERKRIREAENQRYAAQNDNAPETQDDKTIYRFCGVVFSQDNHPYHYRTEDKSIQVGDVVVVPAGNQEKEVTVVSVGDYMRMGAPYPVDKAKFILRKAIRTNE